MDKQAPGRCDRESISIMELFDMFPDEQAARNWIEGLFWLQGRHCPHCGSTRTSEVKNEKPMPYRCKDCLKHFSVKTGTVMQSSKLSLRKWVFGIYLLSTNLKGVSSMKLHRDLGITQKTAWMMAQKIREGWQEGTSPMNGPVEVDETYIGGKEKNKHSYKKLRAGRGAVGKVPVVGAKDRKTNKIIAIVAPNTKGDTLKGFVRSASKPDAMIYTDDNRGYIGLRNHETVCHSVSEYVRGQAHTNGIESFWAILKRGYHGTYHHMSPKHLNRYVTEFSGRHNVRNFDTIDQMKSVIAGFVGKRLRYQDLVCE